MHYVLKQTFLIEVLYVYYYRLSHSAIIWYTHVWHEYAYKPICCSMKAVYCALLQLYKVNSAII